jgi:hypothetical protein
MASAVFCSVVQVLLCCFQVKMGYYCLTFRVNNNRNWSNPHPQQVTGRERSDYTNVRLSYAIA